MSGSPGRSGATRAQNLRIGLILAGSMLALFLLSVAYITLIH